MTLEDSFEAANATAKYDPVLHSFYRALPPDSGCVFQPIITRVKI